MRNYIKKIDEISFVLLVFIQLYSEAIPEGFLNYYIIINFTVILSGLLLKKKKLKKDQLVNCFVSTFILSSIFIGTLGSDLSQKYALFMSLALLGSKLKISRMSFHISGMIIILILLHDFNSVVRSVILNSRGALLAGPISISLLMVIYTANALKLRKRVYSTLSFAFAIITQSKGPMLAFLLTDKRAIILGVLIVPIFVNFSDPELIRLDSIMARVDIIQKTLSHTQFIGHGINSSMTNFGNYPHNILIQLWYEIGLIFGTLIYLSLIFYTIRGGRVTLIIFISGHFSFNVYTVIPLILLIGWKRIVRG